MSSTIDDSLSLTPPTPATPSPDSADTQSEILLLEWLADRDVPCPLCAYNLHGLKTPRCPECGTGLQLSVSPIDLPLRPWISLIVALLLPAGFGILIIVAFIYSFIREGFRNFSFSNLPPPGPAWILSHLVLSVPLSILALACRRRFLRLSVTTQRLCASLAWAAIGITILVLIAEIARF